MARKDKPYLPLYVQDILTDEKLIECSAQSHGVYLRLMCILHKQEKYGLLCLKQKYKQNESKNGSKVYEFAQMLSKQMPFAQTIIQESLQELLSEGVISIQEDNLFQKRMLADGELSIIRSDIGKTGGSNVTKQYGRPGYLYWIGDNGLKNKIGVSVNILNRLYRLRSDLKLKKLTIQDQIAVIDMGAAEDFSLSFLNDIRDGEWIKISHEEMEQKFALLKANIKANALANNQANSDIDIENENDTVIDNINTEGVGEKSKTQKKNDMSKKSDTKDIPLPFTQNEFSDKWAEWLKYRSERRLAAYTPTGLKVTLNRLLKDCGGDCAVAVEMIDYAMSKTWQGIFPLKTQINGNTTRRTTEKPTPSGTVAPGGFGQF